MPTTFFSALAKIPMGWLWKSIVNVARRSGIRIFFVPHHRWEPGDYTHWKHATTRQLAGAKNQMFAKGTWGGEWHPDFVPQEGDIIIKEHWAQSGFANTDLDQQLKQHGIEKIILIGMLAHLHRVHRPFRDGARLPRHLSQRCDGRFQLGRNARCRAKRSNLCARNRLHQRNGGCFVQSLNRLCR
jgi:hypothetical protein